MFSCARLFRTTLDLCSTPKIVDVFSNALQRVGWEFDHVAIDVSCIAAMNTYITRDLSGHERDTETVKIIHKQLTNTILRRIQPKKSLILVFDGSEPLWNVQYSRQSPGKRFEERFYRRAGSPMIYQLENRLCSVTDELRRPPMEFLVSGSGVPGPAEGKLSAWMLDLATRILHPAKRPASAASVDVNDSFCLLGNMDLFLVALGCTAFHNITTLSLVQGEFKSLFLQDGLAWMRALPSASLDAPASNLLLYEPRQLAAVRTDLVLLYLLAHGIAATNLPSLNVPLGDLVSAYYVEWQAANPPNHSNHSAAGPLPYRGILFDEFPLAVGADERAGLWLKPTALAQVLARACPCTPAASSAFPSPASDASSAAYLELLLQSHAMLCEGGVPHLGWVPSEGGQTLSGRPDPASLLRYLCKGNNRPDEAPHEDNNKDHNLSNSSEGNNNNNNDNSSPDEDTSDDNSIAPVRDRTFALTGLESMILGASRADLVEPLLSRSAGGEKMATEVIRDIVETSDIHEALAKTRTALREMGLVAESTSGDTPRRPENDHPAIRHYPTHYFVRTANARGPPPGWSYFSVNLGLKAETMNIRYALNQADPDALPREFDSPESQGRSRHNTLHVFDAATECWTEVSCEKLRELPVEANGESPLLSTSEGEPVAEQTTLRVLTWNVQFDRHSGERTPLGRTGIDWCTSTRYLALSEVLSQADADVIGMQEVEPGWCSFLCQQPWVRERYALSCQENGHAISPWGVMLLLRKDMSIKAFQHANVPAFIGHTSVMPEVTLTLSKHVPPVIVGSMHLLAPYNQNNVNNRETQLDNLLKRLKSLASATADPSTMLSHILTGDFNDSSTRFFRIPKELGYRDAWEVLHPHWAPAATPSSASPVAAATEAAANSQERGYTIDGEANPYTRRIIEPEFYGRPDRVLYSSAHLQPTHAELVGTQSVLEVLRTKGITKQVDRPQEDIPDYLFPSDHFGVLVEFQVL